MKTKTVLIAVSVVFVLSTCSAMNGMGQMMVDAGELLMDAGNSHAQTNTPQKVVTAETDLAQQVGGMQQLSGAVELVTGPVIIRDLFANRRSASSASGYAWLSPAGTACAAIAPDHAIEIDGYHLSRLFVPASQKLCALSYGTHVLNWAGYRPY